jgi:spermidine/putrescine transport system substrate-binding protein
MKGVEELLADRRYDRRELLRGGAGLALGLGLAGCGVGGGADTGDKKASQRKVAKRVDGDLVYFNYSEYVDPKLVKEFEKRHDVKVRESYFDSMQAMMAKLRAGNRYDVIFPSAEFCDRLIQGNQLLRIDPDNLKGTDAVYSALRSPYYDRDRQFTTPYALYATGLGYRADKVPDMTGSWKDVVIPSAQGRSFLLDDFQEDIGMANLVNGYDLNTVVEAELEKSKDFLVSLKPKLRGFSTDTITNMTSGNAWVQHLWNGDIVNIRNQVDNPEDFKFQKCSEGIPVGNDAFAVPANARHPGTALLFIEFMLEPENAARNVEYIGYPMPYEGAPKEAFAELVKDDPSIEVTVDDLEGGDQFENLKGEGRRAWDRVWSEVRAS